ncbi:MAG: hypothetical protein ACO1OF_16430 [Adhaeribacter sp.]
MLLMLLTWLEGNQDYTTGCELFRQLQPLSSLNKVFALGNTPFNTQKLLKELQNHYLQLQAESKVQAAIIKATAVPEKTTETTLSGLLNTIAPVATPEAVTQLKEERSRLFKEASHLHSQLLLVSDMEKRKLVALRILANFSRNEEIWDKLMFFEKHGFLPDQADNTPAAPPDEEPLSLAGIVRRLHIVRPKLSRLKQQLPNQQDKYDALLKEKFYLEQEKKKLENSIAAIEPGNC